MSNVRHIRVAKTTNQQASEWVALLATGEATAEEQDRCTAWLQEDASHQEAFDQLSLTWGQIRAIGDEVRSTVAAKVETEAMADHHAATKKKELRRWPVAWTAVASMAAVLFVMAGGMLMYPFDTSTLYRTEVGQQETFTLADESTMQLNTDTEVLVAYSDRARTIELRRGEAFFDVAHDSSRPFVVEAGQGEIRAVGTGFVVRVRNDAVKVTVTEGVVEVTHDAIGTSGSSVPAVEVDDVSSAKSSAQLSEGQRVEYDQRVVSVAVLAPEELDRDLAWRQGLLLFDGQSLEEVIREIGRYTDTRIVIADSDLQRLRVGGAFQAGDLEAVLEFFEKGLNIAVNRDVPRTIYLTAARPGTGE